ncbi:hypothetical protein [Streptomyces poonensis]|uniref:Uncharacterized protein n=1 Tax=Streptomyces poonensis TaxID=68255 RepID=A0A918PF50_9ACTN|nr:hypothetical protein [Streptomyces poonensis]GGZ02881.1 hypothetical protein GCM10010365_22030 [Streptomyces poonensis]GLJ93856.1 hypothetical protein GCM10017589_64730 [Streptomyces poonensis]
MDRAFTPPAGFVPLIGLHTGITTEEIRLEPADQVAATVGAFVTAVRAGSAPRTDTLRQAVLPDAVRRRSA